MQLNDKSELYAEDTKRMAQLTNDLSSIMQDTWQSAVREGESFGEVLRGLEQQLLRLGDRYLLQPLLDQLAQMAMYQMGFGGGGAGGFAGIFGSILGTGATMEVAGQGAAKGIEALANVAMSAAVAHTGGVIGETALPTRPVPAAVFLDAPRYHSGGFAGRMPFASDEVPAVLRRGEMVLTERQQKAVASSGGRPIVVNQTVKTEDPGAFNRTRGQMAVALRRDLWRAARSA